MDSSEGRTYKLTQINITGYDYSCSLVLLMHNLKVLWL